MRFIKAYLIVSSVSLMNAADIHCPRHISIGNTLADPVFIATCKQFKELFKKEYVENDSNHSYRVMCAGETCIMQKRHLLASGAQQNFKLDDDELIVIRAQRFTDEQYTVCAKAARKVCVAMSALALICKEIYTMEPTTVSQALTCLHGCITITSQQPVPICIMSQPALDGIDRSKMLSKRDRILYGQTVFVDPEGHDSLAILPMRRRLEEIYVVYKAQAQSVSFDPQHKAFNLKKMVTLMPQESEQAA